jgi:hypothetical protein
MSCDISRMSIHWKYSSECLEIIFVYKEDNFVSIPTVFGEVKVASRHPIITLLNI